MSAIRPALAHFGIFVWDLPVMEGFYTKVFGLEVTDRGVGKTFKNELVFLTAAADQHHQVVLSSGRVPGAPSSVMQMSFKVDDLAQLKAVREIAFASGAKGEIRLNHGNAWSVYFDDPEGNRIEVYLDTPFHTPQPCGEPWSLESSEADLLLQTEQLIAGLAGSMPRGDYIKEMTDRLDGR